MKGLYLTDQHVHPFNEFSRPTRDGQTTLLKEHLATGDWVAEQIDAHKPDFVVNIGDHVLTIGYVDALTLTALEHVDSRIRDACRAVGAKYFPMLGNHDLSNDATRIHVLPFIDGLISEPQIVDGLFMFPFYRDWKEIFELWKDRAATCRRAFIHLDIIGARFNFASICKAGISPSEFPDTCRVIAGHFHHPQNLSPTFHCIGSIMYRDFRDEIVDEPRGIIIDNLDTGEWLRIENPCTSIYHTVRVNDEDDLAVKLAAIQNKDRCHVRVSYPESLEPFVRQYKDDFRSMKTVPLKERRIATVNGMGTSAEAGFEPFKVLQRYLELNRPDGELDPYLQYGNDIINKVIGTASKSKPRHHVRAISMHAENFMSYLNLDVRFDEDGVVYVDGVIQDQEADVSNGCFVGDTRIPLLDGSEVPIRDLVDREEFWLYSQKSNGAFVPGRGHLARLTHKNAPVFKVKLDSGESLRCTGNHPFMLLDGSYQAAEKLVAGSRLMPLYRKINEKGYEETWDNHRNRFFQTHWLVDWIVNDYKRLPKAWVIHHNGRTSTGAYDKRNNSPENLVRMKFGDHGRMHSLEPYQQVWRNPEAVIRQREGTQRMMRERWESDDHFRQKISAFITNLNRDSEVNIRRTNSKRNSGYLDKLAFRTRLLNDELGLHHFARMKSYVAKARRTLEAIGVDDPREVADYEWEAFRTKGRGVSVLHNHACDLWEAGWHTHSVLNHEVVSVEPDGFEDVYDITVDDHHNFAVAPGVYVHNSGKSAIFEAIHWCWFGELIRSSKDLEGKVLIDDVVNDQTKSNCLVSFQMIVDDVEYQLLRTRKHREYGNDLRIFHNGELMAQGLEAAKKYLESITGVDQSLFRHTTLLVDSLSTRFSQLSGRDRLELMEGVIQLGLYDQLYVAVNVDLKAAKLEHDAVKISIERDDRVVVELVQQRTKLAEGLSAMIHNLQETITQKQVLLSTAVDEQQRLAITIVEAQKLASQLADAKHVAQKTIPTFDTKQHQAATSSINRDLGIIRKTLQDKTAMLNGMCPTCNRPLASDPEHQAILRAEVNSLNVTIDDHEEALKKWQAWEVQMRDSIKSFEARYTEAASAYNLQLESIRGFGAQNLTLEGRVKGLRGDIELATSTFNSSQGQLTSIDGRILAVNTELVSLRSQLQGMFDRVRVRFYWDTALSPKGGVRMTLLQDSLAQLSEYAVEYSNSISNGRVSPMLFVTPKGEIGFETMQSIGSRKYGLSSSGQRRAVDIGIQLALTRLSARFSGFTSNILILDEIDDKLDASARRHLIGLLGKIADGDKKIVLIASHNKDCKSYVEKVWTAMQVDGISRLVV